MKHSRNTSLSSFKVPYVCDKLSRQIMHFNKYGKYTMSAGDSQFTKNRSELKCNARNPRIKNSITTCIWMLYILTLIAGCSVNRSTRSNADLSSTAVPLSRKPAAFNLANIKELYKKAKVITRKDPYETQAEYNHRSLSSSDTQGTQYFMINNAKDEVTTGIAPEVKITYSPDTELLTVSASVKSWLLSGSYTTFLDGSTDAYGTNITPLDKYTVSNGLLEGDLIVDYPRYLYVGIDGDYTERAGRNMRSMFGASYQTTSYSNSTYMFQLQNIKRDSHPSVGIALLAHRTDAKDLIENNALTLVLGIKVGDYAKGFSTLSALVPTVWRPSFVGTSCYVLPGQLMEVIAVDKRTMEVIGSYKL